LDLSAKADLTAKALIFHDGEDDDGAPRFAAFVHGYTPADTLRIRAERDRCPYELWVEAGFITATPGEKTRMDFVARDIAADADRFELQMVVYDQFLIADLKMELDTLGLEFPLVDHPQGWNKRKRLVEGSEIELGMPWSVDALETLILERRLRVHVNPALRAAVASAEFERSPADLRRFTKVKSFRRIDMLVALTMGIGAAVTAAPPMRSYLETEGLMLL
jgi:phage terminase large subunit-like protein